MKRGKNKTAWGLDEAMDNLLIVEEQFPTTTTTTTTQQRQRQRQQLGQRPRSYSAAAPLPASPTSPTNQVHRISATPLSHHNSIASSASTRSTQSRHSTFSTSSSNTDNTLPVTVYEVPHTYDDNEPSPTTSQTTSDGVITLSPRIYVNQPHFVVAAFGMIHIAQWLFDNISPNRETQWNVDSATATLTYSPFTNKQNLLSLGDDIGVSTFVVIASSLEMFFQQLDIADKCMDAADPDKLWWRRLVLIVDQHTSKDMLPERERFLHDQLPKILWRYGMTHNPAVMFVTASGQHYEEYTNQCKQVLRQLIDSNHRLGRWRPHEDEDDFLDASVIHLGPQGKMPVRSMTRYNR